MLAFSHHMGLWNDMQDPYAEKRKNVLNNTQFGNKLLPPSALAHELSMSLIQPGSGSTIGPEFGGSFNRFSSFRVS